MEIGYSDYYKKSAKKLKLSEEFLKTVDEDIQKLPLGDVKPVKTVPNGYRLRVEGYRVLYAHKGEIISVLSIKPRDEAYEKTTLNRFKKFCKDFMQEIKKPKNTKRKK